MKSLSVYIIHYSKLVERVANIEDLFTRLDVQNDPSRIVLETSVSSEVTSMHQSRAAKNSSYFIEAQLPIVYRSVIMNAHNGNTFTGSIKENCTDEMLRNNPFISMKPPSLSTIEHCLQHYTALARFLCCEDELCLVLEDDAIINCSRNDLEVFTIAAMQLSRNMESGCYFDLSDGCRLKPYSHEALYSAAGFSMAKMNPPRSRTSAAYLLDKSAAARISLFLQQAYMAIDWHITYCLNMASINCFWISQPFFCEGSGHGLMKSNAPSRIMNNGV